MTERSELAILDRASQAIEQVATIGEAKNIADKAAAIKVIAAKQGWSQREKGRVSEIEVRATVRLGELLEDAELHAGRPKKNGSRGEPLSGGLDDLGVTKKQSHIAQRVASVPVKERETYIAEHKDKGGPTVTGLARLAKERGREAKREKDRQAVEDAPEPTELEGVFSTIVIDPPWDFGDEGDVDQFGRGKPDYATMTIDQIADLPVGERAADDAHLYLWITNRSLPKGFDLLDAWGFRYITCLTWCKPSIGMGNYFRGSTEQVLFGVRGSLSLNRKNVGTWFQAPRPKRKHSSKPPEFFDLVESCSPGPYLEMFSRTERDGWTAWGSGK